MGPRSALPLGSSKDPQSLNRPRLGNCRLPGCLRCCCRRCRVTLGGPRTDYFAGCIPEGLHHTSTHAAAQGILLDH